jgi:methionyl-tRNA formyltransferase
LGGKQLKIHRAHADALHKKSPSGTVVSVSNGICVATGEGTLVLDEVQLEGRKRLPAVEFSRGSIKVGVVLGAVS